MFRSFDAQWLMDQLADGVLLVGEDGTILAANRRCTELFGHEVDALVGSSIELIVPEPHRGAHPSHRSGFVVEGGRRPMCADRYVTARHRDGEWIDVRIVLALLEGTTTTMAIVHDVGAERAQLHRLRAEVDLVVAVARGAAAESVMGLAADRLRDLLHADAAWIWLCDAATDELTMVAGASDGGRAPADVSVSDIAAALAAAGETMIVDAGSPGHPFDGYTHLGYGSILAARIGRQQMEGVLVAGRIAGRRAFSAGERLAAERYADVTLVAVELDRSRDALDRLAISAERVRVARELHDTVIQRLFAIGLRLEGATEDAPPAVVTDIDTALEQLDATTREIRETILELDQGAVGRPLRRLIEAMAAEFAEPAGLVTAVEVDDDLDDRLPSDVRHHLVTALRECLANVVRHARATKLTVSVTAADGRLTAVVTDDGIGPPAEGGHRGHGLANLTARASQLGGDFRLDASGDGGTTATWRVPFGRPAR